MTQNTSSTNILIIEDEIAIAEGLVDLCELNGYRVKHVVDGESGLAEALSGQYGLVLLDLMLPGMDGFTVCDKIREKDKSLPIIILSAKNSDDDIINGLKFGADDYIPKPFSVPMLLATTTSRSRSLCRCSLHVSKLCFAVAARRWKMKASLLPATSA